MPEDRESTVLLRLEQSLEKTSMFMHIWEDQEKRHVSRDITVQL